MVEKASGQKGAGAQRAGLRTKRHVLQPDRAPTGLHHVSFSRVGGEIVMEVGFFDMPELVERLNEARSTAAADSSKELMIDATVKIVAQYSMAADTFLRLRQHVNEIYTAMLESGDIKDPESIKLPGEE